MSTTGDTFSERDPEASGKATCAPHLFLELECERPHIGPARYSLAGVDVVRIGRGEQRAVRIAADGGLEISLPDSWVSKAHAEIRRGPEGFTIHDVGSKNGIVVDGEAVRSADLADESLAQVGRTFFTFRSSVPARGPRYVEAADLPGSGSGLATLSPAFEDLLLRAKAVAASPVSVVLRGESGVGKEVLAHAIHAWSGRRGAFVPVNCGAIAQELVESELFGHLKGAFSGAVRDHPGLIRSLDGGTLFLDEVGDLPLPGAGGAASRPSTTGSASGRCNPGTPSRSPPGGGHAPRSAADGRRRHLPPRSARQARGRADRASSAARGRRTSRS